MSNPAPAALPTPMPDDLKAKGWRMSRVPGDPPTFRAKNNTLKLYSSAMATPELAIDAARELDAGKTQAVRPDGGIEFLNPKGPERRTIALGVIRLDGDTQPREDLDLETIEKYALAMLAGDVFPPVTLFHDGKNYWLADGFHRYFARKKHTQELGLEIDAEIYQGTKRDAQLYSLGANESHGLPRTNEDKRAAVQKLLTDEEWSKWSDGAIAKAAHVSQPFVSKLRRALPLIDGEPEAAPTQNVLSGPRAPLTERTAPEPRRGADNRVINTANIGRKAPAKPNVSPALIDIAPLPPSAEAKKSATPAAAADPDGWSDLSILLTITINPGKTARRKITLGGKAGDGKPLFRSDFSTLELEPMPPAITAILADLKKAYAKSGAKPTTTPKKKPAPKKKRPTSAPKKPARHK